MRWWVMILFAIFTVSCDRSIMGKEAFDALVFTVMGRSSYVMQYIVLSWQLELDGRAGDFVYMPIFLWGGAGQLLPCIPPPPPSQ